MPAIRSRLRSFRGLSAAESLRLVFRKLIYRKVVVGRYEQLAGKIRRPASSLGSLRIDFLDSTHSHLARAANPNLTAEDVDHLREQDSVWTVVYDQDRIIASFWITSGDVYISELHRHVRVPPGEYYTLRSYVFDEYRGRELLAHMYYAYAQQVPPDDLVWGFIYNHNIAPMRTALKNGRVHTADYWTTWVFGYKFPGERHFAPRPPDPGVS